MVFEVSLEVTRAVMADLYVLLRNARGNMVDEEAGVAGCVSNDR